jgi:hypothetical protein
VGEVLDERKWLTSRSPRPLLEYLEGRASARQWRLFACAVGRRLPRLRWGAENRERDAAIETAERFADRQASEEELRRAARRYPVTGGGESSVGQGSDLG